MRLWVLALLQAGYASAQEPTPSPTPEPTPAPAPQAPAARPINLRGRIFARGSINSVAGATLTGSSGETATSDAAGRFALSLPDGDVDLVIGARGYRSLTVREHLRPGEGLTVEYRLLADSTRRYESTVTAAARHEGEHFSLQGEEAHNLPGTMGDPFHAVALMPGVATPVTLLPLYVIRGASPGMNGFFLDGMRVPQLFHVLIGGGVVNGRLVDRLDFFPGSYDASFGHYAGGIIDSETRPARRDGQHGEVQLRLYDLTGAVELALPRGVGITFSGSYGWPGAFVKLFSKSTDVQYGDYQLRLDWKGLTVQVLGSYDSITIQRRNLDGSTSSDEFRLTFHRLQLRYRGRKGRLTYETALIGGYDQMISFGGSGVEKLGLGWRALLSVRWRRVRFDAGLDGELSRFRGIDFGDLPGASPGSLGELAGTRNGVVAGGYALVAVELIPQRLAATLSGRADVYYSDGVTLVGLDPRLNLRAQLKPWLSLNAGGGVYHQPPGFPVPLPGLDTFALELGLQTAYHASAGGEVVLPKDFTFSLTGYYQRFHNIADATLDFTNVISCSADPPEPLKGIPAQLIRLEDGQAYGAEMLLRRRKGMITGWISYTVGRSERFLPCGARPSDFDETHILNVVVQARLPRQVMVGARLYLATGRPATAIDPTLGYNTPRNNWRMPTYVQLDLRLDREWIFQKWALDGFLEILNVTYSESALGVQYPYDPQLMAQRLDKPEVSGFRWILPSLGLRGRF
jgi:hypothetical protein